MMQPGDAIKLQVNVEVDGNHVNRWGVGLVLATTKHHCLILWSGHDPMRKLDWFDSDVLDDCAELMSRTCAS